MDTTIYILHRNVSLAETLAWTLQLGTDLKVICWTDPKELSKAIPKPDLVLTEADFFDNILTSYEVPVLIITGTPGDDKVIEALYAGADDIADLGMGPTGIIDKVQQLLTHQTDEKNILIKTIIQKNIEARQGDKDNRDYGLTAKEKEILIQMRDGNHLKLIAQATNTSYETVRTHVKHIYKKLGVMSASEAVVKAMKMKLLKK